MRQKRRLASLGSMSANTPMPTAMATSWAEKRANTEQQQAGKISSLLNS
jgi:hypothetical protein